jgi:peptidoglycan/xylan/chitin deacetylase (PgdA/CDA1 family)
MLNFRNSIIGFALLLATMYIAGFFMPVSSWLYAAAVSAFSGALVYGSVRICAGFYIRSWCSGNRNSREVAITFDDGPDEQVTPLLLDLLKEYEVQAAFFLVGEKAERYPSIAIRSCREGHIIGGHSYSHHKWFDLFSRKRMEAELKKTENVILNHTGNKIRLFRPPYGVTNPNLARAVRNAGFYSIGWSLKSRDTVIHDEQLLLRRITKKVRSGDILLFHDTMPHMLPVMKELISYLKEQNLKVVRLDKLLNIDAYAGNK